MPCATRPSPSLLALALVVISALPDFLPFALSFATIFPTKPAASRTNGLIPAPSRAIFVGESPSPGHFEEQQAGTRGPPDEPGLGEDSDRSARAHPVAGRRRPRPWVREP